MCSAVLCVCLCVSLYITHDLISAGSLFLAPPLFISHTAGQSRVTLFLSFFSLYLSLII